MSNNTEREKCVSKLQGHLKGATGTVHEIEELLLSQEHLIRQQAREIEELRRRLKELEDLGFQSEQILHLQNINVQLKTQIEFLRGQNQEKDAMIAQFSSKPVQSASAEMLAAQQQLIQQNLTLQNIIGDLQNQILNKDAVIGQLKTQDSTLDQLIGQLTTNIQNKRTKVGVAKNNNDTMGILNELQQYPEALQDISERIIQEYRKMQFLLEEKDIEIQNLKARLQLQQQKANDSIQEIQKRDISPIRSDQALNLAKQNAAMDDVVNDLERKLIWQDNRKKELQSKLFEIGSQNADLEKQLTQIKDQLPKTVDELVNANLQTDDLIRELQKKLIQKQQESKDLEIQVQDQLVQISQQMENSLQNQPKQQIKEIKQENDQQQMLNEQQKVDSLVGANQELENLIAELQQKLVEKEDQKDEIIKAIQNIDIPSLEKMYQELDQKQIQLSSQVQEKTQNINSLNDQLKNITQEQEQVNNQLKDIQNQINQVNQEINSSQSNLDQLLTNQKGNDEQKKIKEKLQQTENNNQILEQLVQQLQAELKQQIQDLPTRDEYQSQQLLLQQTELANKDFERELKKLEDQLQNQIKISLGLQQRLDNQLEQAEKHSQTIRESMKEIFDSNSSNSEIVEQKQKITEKQKKADELVREHLSLDDLINELERKLVEKSDYKAEIEKQLGVDITQTNQLPNLIQQQNEELNNLKILNQQMQEQLQTKTQQIETLQQNKAEQAEAQQNQQIKIDDLTKQLKENQQNSQDPNSNINESEQISTLKKKVEEYEKKLNNLEEPNINKQNQLNQQIQNNEQNIDELILKNQQLEDLIHELEVKQLEKQENLKNLQTSQNKPIIKEKKIDQKFREPFLNLAQQEEYSFDLQHSQEQPEVVFASPENIRQKTQQTGDVKEKQKPEITISVEILKNYEQLIAEQEQEIVELKQQLALNQLQQIPINIQSSEQPQQEIEFQSGLKNDEEKPETIIQQLQEEIQNKNEQITRQKQLIEELKQIPKLNPLDLEQKFNDGQKKSDELVQKNLEIADAIITLEEKLENKKQEANNIKKQLNDLNTDFELEKQKLDQIKFYNFNEELGEEGTISPKLSMEHDIQIDQQETQDQATQVNKKLKEIYEKKIADLKQIINNLRKQIAQLRSIKKDNPVNQSQTIPQINTQQYEDQLKKQNELIADVQALQDIINSLEQKIAEKTEQKVKLESQFKLLDSKLDEQQLASSATMASTIKLDQDGLQKQYDQSLEISKLKENITNLNNENQKLQNKLNQINQPDQQQQDISQFKENLTNLNNENQKLQNQLNEINQHDQATQNELQNQRFISQQQEISNQQLLAEVRQLEDQLTTQIKLNQELQGKSGNDNIITKNPQQLTKSFNSNSSNSEIIDLRQKQAEKQKKADDLITDNQCLDDIINDLERKLAEKDEKKNYLVQQIQQDIVVEKNQQIDQQNKEILPINNNNNTNLENEQIEIPVQFGNQQVNQEDQANLGNNQLQQDVIKELPQQQMDQQILNPTRSEPTFPKLDEEHTLKQVKSAQIFGQVVLDDLDKDKVSELWNLIKSNNDMDKRIQELKNILGRKQKRKDQLENIVQMDQDYQKDIGNGNEKKELQTEIHQKNLQIANLKDEMTKINEKLFEKDKVINEKEREFRNSQLINQHQELCDQADELVRKNLEMTELVQNLEKKFAEQQQRAKELEQQMNESSLSNVQEPRDSQIAIKSYDQEQDTQLKQQEEVLLGYTLNIDQLKNKIEQLTNELTEKEKLTIQLQNQITDLKKEIHKYQLSQQDESSIKKQNKKLESQFQKLVEDNLTYEDLIRDNEFKLLEKKSKVKELEMEIKNAEIQIQIEKQKKEEELLQQKRLQTDELIKKNLEMDEALTNLELRLLDKQQQITSREAKLSQSQSASRILPQQIYIYHEDPDEKGSNVKTDASPRAEHNQDKLILEHNQTLTELQNSISQAQEYARLISNDEDEVEFYLQQKKDRSLEIEQIKQFLQQSQEKIKELQNEKQDKQEQIEQLQKENANFDELVVDLQNKQKQMIEEEVQKEGKQSNQVQEIAPEKSEIQKSISENLELVKQLHDLKQAQNKLKNQIANLDSIIIDLETVVTEKKNEMSRISRDNQLYQAQNRKHKNKRDQLHKEQNSLQQALKLLESSIQDLKISEKQADETIIKLNEKLKELKKTTQTLEDSIQEQDKYNQQILQKLQELNQEKETNNKRQIVLNEELQQLRASNNLIEKEVLIYRDLNLEDESLNSKISLITTQIEEDKQFIQTLNQEQQNTREQIDLLIPQNKEIEQLKENVKQQYNQNLIELMNMQEELKNQTEQKSQVFKAIQEINQFLDENQNILSITQTQKQELEENLKRDESLLSAILDKLSRVQKELDQEKELFLRNDEELQKIKAENDQISQNVNQLRNQINQLQLEEQKLKELQNNYQHQKDLIQQLEQDIEINMKIIPEKENQKQTLQDMITTKEEALKNEDQNLKNLEDQLKQKQDKLQNIQEFINKENELVQQIEDQIVKKLQEEQDLKEKLDKIVIKDLEQALQEKLEHHQAQQEILESIEKLKEEYQNQKDQEGNIIQLVENQKEANNEQRKELEKQIAEKQKLQEDFHQTVVQLEEMTFQVKDKSEQLEKLNEQFKNHDEESKIIEAVLQLKEKELKQLQKKKENLIEELEKTNLDLMDTQKQLTTQRKKQRSLGAEPLLQEEVSEENIQDKITQLNSKNNDLKDDLQKLVVEQAPEPKEQEDNSKYEQLQQVLIDKDKKIEILSQQIDYLQSQINERISHNPIKGKSEITDFFFDDDPILLELQEKFLKESELLKDLQNKIKETAESHYKLSQQLKEWAEKENRLANELDTRRLSVEQIEKELQIIFNKQANLESDKTNTLIRIFQLESENQELIEQEQNTKNKLKEKKDYLQILYKNLTESDQKLLQLRNRMAIYSQEGRQLAEQVENLENEKENKLQLIQDIQEELDHSEIEKSEKQQLIQSIKKEISETQAEKDKLENQFAIMHSKNLQLKSQIGFEESLYDKLIQELEIQKKRDQTKYQNLITDGSTQTEYDIDQFEALLNGTSLFKITREDILQLKENCKHKLVEIYQQDGDNITKFINGNKNLQKLIYLQQMMITCQENENAFVIEQNSRRSSKFGFNALNESIFDIKIQLEQIDTMMNKTFAVDVQISDHQILIGENKLARQWIIEKQFDYDNHLYPLGVLNIIYKVSLYQVISISLTGTKVLQLYQSLV